MSLPRQPPLSEIDLYWTDEQIISLLEDYLPGSRLPENVLEDASPFLYPPSSLPEGMWYLVHLNQKKESAHGFWKPKGEACKVYSNTAINGWRSTLEYFEGLPPDGQRTDWAMQEYMIAPKESNDKDKAEDSRVLCRVFLSRGETSPPNCKTIADKDTGEEPHVKREYEVEIGEEFDEADCISRGDFLELNDLVSHSSSSSSYLSEEYSAFLRDIEKNIKEEKEEEELLQLLSSPTEKIVVQGGTLSPPPSSSDGGGGGGGGVGGGGGGSSRMNKLRTYFCFATF